MVNLMIILFHLKLNKFYCIGVINQFKVICFNLLFFCLYKKNVFQQTSAIRKIDIIIAVVKKAAEYYLENKDILKENTKKKKGQKLV